MQDNVSLTSKLNSVPVSLRCWNWFYDCHGSGPFKKKSFRLGTVVSSDGSFEPIFEPCKFSLDNTFKNDENNLHTIFYLNIIKRIRDGEIRPLLLNSMAGNFYEFALGPD